DAPAANQALCALAACPGQALPFLQERLRAADSVDPGRIARLVVELDHRRFTVREQASRDLADLAELAEPTLTQAVAGRLPPAARGRPLSFTRARRSPPDRARR